MSYVFSVIILLLQFLGEKESIQENAYAPYSSGTELKQVKSFYFTADHSGEKVRYTKNKISPGKVTDQRLAADNFTNSFLEAYLKHRASEGWTIRKGNPHVPLKRLLLFPNHYFW